MTLLKTGIYGGATCIIAWIIFEWFVVYMVSVNKVAFTIDYNVTSNNILMSLNDDTIKEFHENGFVVVKNLIPKNTINIYSKFVDHVFANPSLLLQLLQYGKLCGKATWMKHIISGNEWKNISFRAPWIKMISQLLYGDPFMLMGDDHFHSTNYNCWAMNKGIGIFHSDATQAPYTTINNKTFDISNRLIGVWVPINESNVDSFYMELIPKSHQYYNLYYGNNHAQFSNELYCNILDDAVVNVSNGLINVTKLFLNVGDVVFFKGLLIHRVIAKSNENMMNNNDQYFYQRMSFRYLSFNHSDVLCKSSIINPFYWSICPKPLQAPTVGYDSLIMNNDSYRTYFAQTKRVLPSAADWALYFMQKMFYQQTADNCAFNY